MLDKEWVKGFEGKLAPKVHRVLENVGGPEEKVKLIVEFDNRRDFNRSRVRRAIKKMGGSICRELPLINSLAVEIPAGALKDFIPAHKLKMVWHDHEVQTKLNIAVPAIHGDTAFNSGYTGKGVTVAVLDTGIDPHPDLVQPRSRIVGWKDFVGGKDKPYDDNGHGTHVAGIIAGNGTQSGGKYRGVAPEARLVGVKVLDKNGKGSASQVVAGVQWAVRNRRRYRIRVMNLSMGAPVEEGYLHDPISRAVESAWASGIVVCVAAGNEGPEAGTILTPGIAPSVITVGNMDDCDTVARRDDKLASSSSRGPTIDKLTKPDILAPGTNIISLKNGGGYVALTGTSMSTPMVSGAAALLLQKQPRMTPADVKKALLAGAENRGYPADYQGAGYLDLINPLELKENNLPSLAGKRKSIPKNVILDILVKLFPHIATASEAERFQKIVPLLQILLEKQEEKPAGNTEPKPFAADNDLMKRMLSVVQMFLSKIVGPSNPWMGLLQSFKQWMTQRNGLPV